MVTYLAYLSGLVYISAETGSLGEVQQHGEEVQKLPSLSEDDEVQRQRVVLATLTGKLQQLIKNGELQSTTYSTSQKCSNYTLQTAE